MTRFFLIFLSILASLTTYASGGAGKTVYTFPIREAIMPAAARLTDKCMTEAEKMNADLIIIDLNTYGGLVDVADSVRTRILNSRIPVIAFINNQAASAGALIAIAADSIYMREGASIGAATVVDQSGSAMPDKYQSFMRSMMRATAESHGKQATVNGTDTVWRWFRDPNIAQAMVDPSVVVAGLIDSTKVLTLTTEEAIEYGFCEGKASSIPEILKSIGMEQATVMEYKPSGLDKLFGFLTNPAFQGVLIMLIIGGIYFELQSPGIGFPLLVSIIGALLYFAPLYIEGLAANWEILLFVVGLVLIALEIFVIPGFGVAGISGIALVVVGLSLATIDHDMLKYIPSGEVPVSYVLTPLFTVIISVSVSIIASIWLGKRFLTGKSALREKIVLTTDMTNELGYVAHRIDPAVIGATGVTATQMRPSGKILIGESYYEGTSEDGSFIEKGIPVKIARADGGVLYCRKA